MKNLSKGLLLVALVFLASCGGKKETDDFSKPTEETTEPAVEQVEETTTEATTSEATADINLGKSLFEGKGTCKACHQPSTKVIGPSLQDIAKIYKEKNADIVKFLKGEGEAIVDPTQFEVMKANFAITKQMTDEELKALEAYIYSFE